MKLKEICEYISDRVAVAAISKENYISTENMAQNKGGVTRASSIPASGAVVRYNNNDILISNIRPYFKKIWQANKIGGCSADVLCIRAKEHIDSTFLYYLLSQDVFFEYVMTGAKGCKMPRGDKGHIMDWEIDIPEDKTEQTAIGQCLKMLDNKIEINKQINDNLEQQAQNIFNHYFIDNPIELGSYSEGVLTDIAVYLNGLAMQKFRPEGSDFGLPVLKIKELGQRSCDNNSDRCSSLIKEEYIVNDGDVIFSWSGTLLVDLWCGGKCGLNQHLFKVTSDTYPKWFYYFWTKHHLDNFIRVAKDKAVTMGHIKRTELEKANIIVPTQDKLSEINRIMSPIITKIINHRIEMRKLAQLRDSLLPQLMSGELKINEIDC